MSRVLLVGEAPNCEVVAEHPGLVLRPDSSGKMHSANRLLKFTGWSQEDYLRIFVRRNVLDFVPPKGIRGRTFPTEKARFGVTRLLREVEDSRTLDDGSRVISAMVVLGRRAASAFEWWTNGEKLDYLQWGRVVLTPRSTISAAIVPHPSGVCRWWNEEKNRKEAREFFSILYNGVNR